MTIAGVIGVIKFALWRIPRTGPEYSIYSRGDQEGFQASSFDAGAIGKVGVVLTDLKPGGYIIVDHVQHQALSEVGYISAGTSIRVVRGEGESLIVVKEKV